MSLQRVPSTNDENFLPLGNDFKATQQNGEDLRDAVNDLLQILDYRINGMQDDSVQHKECERKQAQHSLFFQEIWYVFSHLGILQSHKIIPSCVPRLKDQLLDISSPRQWPNHPQFLLPHEMAGIVQTLSEEKSCRGSKLTPAIQPGFEAVYYEIELV